MQTSTQEGGALTIIDISKEIDFANSPPFYSSLSVEIQNNSESGVFASVQPAAVLHHL
jgi:hypothetical protein